MSLVRRARGIAAIGAALPLSFVGVAGVSGSAQAADDDATYTVTVDGTGSWTNPDDTPASPFIDKDGTFYYSQAHALYGASDPREWLFYQGTDLNDATLDEDISNHDTTEQCNNSPTGVESTAPPQPNSYSQPNYCDLTQFWIDPDTGDWYSLVHNEFTPRPFGDSLHFDGIDYAVSTDQGKTWDIKDHVITSPYSTKRGDTDAFPQQTYYYGDGDPRLFVDTASGYFYAFYGSRVVDKGGSWKAFYEHVARAPIADKMAPESWQKWYDGGWSEPGVGGKESNMTPVTADSPTGYTAPADEYDPKNPGTSAEQVAAGTMPPTSPLFVMDVTYNAYLGLYIGEPQNPDQSGNAAQEIYATDNLATQKWTKIGDTGSYHTASWYRWFLDGANGTNKDIVGKDFRMYCSYACGGTYPDDAWFSEYAKVTIDSSHPAEPVTDGTYRVANADGRLLTQARHGARTTSTDSPAGRLSDWTFAGNGDGSYTITNAGTGQVLGVDSSSTTSRAWGAKPHATTVRDGKPDVGQQWWVVPGTSAENGASTGDVTLVNRYSGTVLSLSSVASRTAELTPARSWDAGPRGVGSGRTDAEQTITLTRVG